jgi:hypothetical protein
MRKFTRWHELNVINTAANKGKELSFLNMSLDNANERMVRKTKECVNLTLRLHTLIRVKFLSFPFQIDYVAIQVFMFLTSVVINVLLRNKICMYAPGQCTNKSSAEIEWSRLCF